MITLIFFGLQSKYHRYKILYGNIISQPKDSNPWPLIQLTFWDMKAFLFSLEALEASHDGLWHFLICPGRERHHRGVWHLCNKRTLCLGYIMFRAHYVWGYHAYKTKTPIIWNIWVNLNSELRWFVGFGISVRKGLCLGHIMFEDLMSSV